MEFKRRPVTGKVDVAPIALWPEILEVVGEFRGTEGLGKEMAGMPVASC